MGLYFHNKTNTTIWLAYAYHAPNCSNVNWAKKGWYKILPSATAKVWSGWAGGDKFFYYAENSSGNRWAGQYFTQLPWNAFDWCWNTGSTNSRNLGLRKIDTISWYYQDYTVNLIL